LAIVVVQCPLSKLVLRLQLVNLCWDERQLTGENVEVVWAEFSTLSVAFWQQSSRLTCGHLKVENLAKVFL